MSKLHRRCLLAISTIAAASALLVAAPGGATAAEPTSSSAQPTATEWEPQAVEDGASGGGAQVVHGSSVGSGAVTEQAAPDRATPSHPAPVSPAPVSAGSYEPEPSVTPTYDEPTSTPSTSAPPTENGTSPVQPAPPAPKPKVSKPIEAEVGAATSLGRSTPPQSASATRPAPTAPSADSGGQGGSLLLPLLLIAALGLVLGFAVVRLRRHRQRAQLEVLWREQAETWEAALRRAEPVQASMATEPKAVVAADQRRIEGVRDAPVSLA
jgi:hypothetical protein